MKSIQMKSFTWIKAGMFYVILMLMTYLKKDLKACLPGFSAFHEFMLSIILCSNKHNELLAANSFLWKKKESWNENKENESIKCFPKIHHLIRITI